MAQVRPSDEAKPMDSTQLMAQPLPMAPYVPPGQQPPTNTTVVINQPSAPTVIMPRAWGTGLWDCCDDTEICMCVMFCQPCHSMMLSQKAGESMCLPLLLPSGTWLIALRTKIREKHNIQGSIAGDCCDVSCYSHLVECQLARELKYIEEVQNMQMMAGPGAQVMQHM